jgi:DNA modification methylase
VKPTALLADALLDVTARGDIVIDPFLGSGSTLVAAEKTGRRCRGVEIDPLYVDVIIRRYQAETGREAILEASGETFTALAARRRDERTDGAARPISGNALGGEGARGGQMAAGSGDA